MNWPRITIRVVAGALFASGMLAATAFHADWREQYDEAAVRVDVLGRERMLTVQAAASARSLADGEPVADELVATTTLLEHQWAAVRDGGAELDLALAETGRRVPAWTDAGQLGVELDAEIESFVAALRSFVAADEHADADVAEIESMAGQVLADVVAAVTAASSPVDTTGLIPALLMFLLALLVPPIIVWREWSRDRRAVDEERARLDASEARRNWLEAITAQVSDDLVVLDREGNLRYVSSGLGTGAAVRDAQHLRSLVHPDEVDAVVATLREVIGGRSSARVECKLRATYDSWRDVEVVMTNLCDDPAVNGVVLAVRDIGERRAAEAEYREMHAIQQFLTENASEALIRLDARARITFASNAVTSLAGVDPREVTGQHLERLVAPSDRTRLRRELHEARWSGGRRRFDVQLAGADGGLGWASVGLGFVMTSTGGHYHVTMSDVTSRVTAEVALEQSEATQRLILDSLAEGVLLIDRDHGIVAVNPSATEIVGVGVGVRFRDQASELGIDLLEMDGEPVADGDSLAERVFRSGTPSAGRRTIFRHAGGRDVICESTALPCEWDDDGHVRLVLVTIRDVTDEVRIESALEAERRLLDGVLESVSTSVVVLDGERRVTLANPAFRSMVGRDAVRGVHLTDLFLPEGWTLPDGTAVAAAIAPTDLPVSDVPVRVATEDGGRDVLFSICEMSLHDGRDGFLLTLTEVTELRRAEGALREMALVDPLTRLPNRRRLDDHLESAMARNIRSLGHVGVIFIDLDGFKAVNDELGHEAGDELLMVVGERLRQVVRSGDLVARIGGDEFVIVVEGMHTPAAMEMLPGRIAEVVGAPISIAGREMSVGASVGAARGRSGDTPSTLLHRADTLMYANKRLRATLEPQPV